MLPDFFQFNLPTKILFQPGLSKDFGSELQAFGMTRLLVITDAVLLQAGLIDPIIEGLKNNGIEQIAVFSDVPPNSEIAVVKKAYEKGKEIDAEGIVAIGGGSVLDTAKTANILLTHGGDLVTDYSGVQTITSPLKPLIAIPTTAGTGSEVTRIAMILDGTNHAKLSFADRYLYSTLTILDPELTFSLPPRGTAMTGMDALTHAIECYTSVEFNPFSKAIATYAISRIVCFLPRAIENGKDLEARGEMLIASNMAGVAFDHSMVGVVHSMSHATGGISNVPHGLANSILLPWGMRYNFEVCSEQYAELAVPLGLHGNFDSTEKKAEAVIEKVVQLRTDVKNLCGLPDRLKDAGVKEEDLRKIAQLAVEDGSSFYNPCEVEEEKVLEFLKKAY